MSPYHADTTSHDTATRMRTDDDIQVGSCTSINILSTTANKRKMKVLLLLLGFNRDAADGWWAFNIPTVFVQHEFIDLVIVLAAVGW